MKTITNNDLKNAAEALRAKWAAEDKAKIDATLTKIANDILDLETLESRGSDELDFHDTAVWCIRLALEKAYEAGMNARA